MVRGRVKELVVLECRGRDGIHDGEVFVWQLFGEVSGSVALCGHEHGPVAVPSLLVISAWYGGLREVHPVPSRGRADRPGPSPPGALFRTSEHPSSEPHSRDFTSSAVFHSHQPTPPYFPECQSHLHRPCHRAFEHWPCSPGETHTSPVSGRCSVQHGWPSRRQRPASCRPELR